MTGEVEDLPGNLNNKDAASHYMKGAKQMIEEERYEDALEFINKAIDVYPSAESHYLRAAICYELQSNYDQVIESAQLCIEWRYKLKESYELLAFATFNLDRYQETIKAADECLRIDRRNMGANYYKAQALSQLGRNQEAKTTYLEIVKYDGIVEYGLYYYVYNNLAYMYLKEGDFENATKYIKESIKCTHLYGNAWDTYGEIMYKQEKYNECVEYMNRAIQLGIEGTEHWLYNSYYFRGMSYKALGYDLDAYNDLSVAVSLKNEDAQKVLDSEFNDNNGKSCKFSTMYKTPMFSSSSNGLTLQAVETTDECTILYLQIKSEHETAWIDTDTYIYDKSTETKLMLLKTEGIGFTPTRLIDGELSFVLVFPALSLNCTEFDFSEGGEEENRFFVKEILLSEKAEQLKSLTTKKKDYTIESAIAEMERLKLEVEHTNNKADLKIIQEAVDVIDRWYFNTPETNRQLGTLIRETYKLIKTKLQQ